MQRMMMAVVVSLFLMSTSAVAATNPPELQGRIRSMISTNPDTLKVPENNQKFYNDWRSGAGIFADLLAGNKDVEKKVGKPIDRQGLLCVLWTKMAELAEESKLQVRAKATEQKRQSPQWLEDAAKSAKKKADEYCQDPTDGYGDKSPNLGVAYLNALRSSSSSVRVSLASDTELVGQLSSLIETIKETVQALPARAGHALTNAPVIILDPMIFMKKECRADCGA